MKARLQAQTKQWCFADRPIYSKKQDILGRSEFAARLAHDICSWTGNDSLVIALYGAWGSGKTSVKNMLLEANRNEGRTPLPVVDFNPWQLSRTGNIPVSFFRELGLALKKEGPERDIEKRGRKLNAYAATLSVVGTTAGWIGRALPWAGVPGGPLVETVGAGMKTAGEAAKEGGEALRAQKEAAAKSLEEQKHDLARLLARLPRPLLVVIDDIDRLTTDEILQVFQLVKANADFPRLIYLLLFEREVVAKALNAISSDKGAEFLEKIVQVGYHVPYASRPAVQKVLFAGLDRYLEDTAILKHWDKQRWIGLFSDGIAGYFRNLRHVYRFLASFAFHVHHHRRGDSFEVNPVDLIGLETLRVFEPAIYERLPGSKTILTRYDKASIYRDIKQEVVDQALSQIVSAAVPESQDSVRAILNALFPPVLPSYSANHEASRHHGEWLRGLRVCHPDLFDKYFTLTVADDDLSQAELDALLALTNDAAGFVAACDAVEKRGLLKIAFDRLDAYKEHIPLENMPSLILGLCDLCDSLPVKVREPFDLDVESLAWRLVYFGLKRERDSKKRCEILRDAISYSAGLALPLHIAASEVRSDDPERSQREYLVDEEDLQTLEDACVERLRTAAKKRGFRRDPRLDVYLWKWSEWASVEEVRSWLATYTRTPKGAVWLLTVLLGETHSYGAQHRMRYYIHLPTVERFADVAQLTRHVGQIDEAKLTTKEARAIHEFRKALARRAEGKADTAWQDERDGYEVVAD